MGPNQTADNLAERIDFELEGDAGRPLQFEDDAGTPKAARIWSSNDHATGPSVLSSVLEERGWKKICDGRDPESKSYFDEGTTANGGGVIAYVAVNPEEDKFAVYVSYLSPAGVHLCEDVGSR